VRREDGWTQAQAERQLRSLELFGMRFGLDRMRRMMTVLGSPERRFRAIQVLGTNGKSSTTRMIAAILERHGIRTGAYLSPHLISYRERIRVAECDVGEGSFAAAVGRATRAAERVNRTLAEDDHVTQFELLTAAAFLLLAEAEVDVAVVEAGLGGRYDATSVLAAEITVLTNVGLEHTRWLGPTIHDIAEEKLAVVGQSPARPTLVLGAELAPDALAVATRVAAERNARIVHASATAHTELAAMGAFQQRNFALATAAAEAQLQACGIAVDKRAIAAAGASTDVPGRFQIVGEDPPTLLDGAHNPDAVAALVAALPAVAIPRPLGLVLGVLEDKDAASMLRALLPVCEHAWFTAPPSSRALPPAALESLARQLGFHASTPETRPALALAQAQRWARERGGSVLATGSVYLVGGLMGEMSETAAAAGAAPGISGPLTR
jgi:dihydrofolate synthase/folylpolyglutamate synthase